jgi:molybdopterin-binding protein
MSDTAAARGENLTVVYRGKTVLDVPRVELRSGQTYVLLGASGAGKSTLLRVLGLLEAPTTGTVEIDGRPVSRSNLAARRRIAAVFQKPYLLKGSVGDNAGYGLALRRVPSPERKRRVADALGRVGLGGWEDRSAATLSGGEAQRVALARAIVLEPQLLLLDEPLSYLDPLLKRDLTLEFAQILASTQVTALYVTHDQDEAAVVADRIGVMREGRIVSEGNPDEMFTLPPDPWVASFLGTESPVAGSVTAAEAGVATIDCGGVSVVAVSGLAVGTKVLLGVRPEDIMLFEAGVDIPKTSARNRLDATIASLSLAGATVRVVVDAGSARFSATVSRSSASSLGLAVGLPVTLLFKATAVRVEPQSNHPSQILSESPDPA